MAENHKKIYIIKKSDNTMLEFSYKEGQGLIYKLYAENKWSENHLLASKASKNYSVILFPDDSLNVLYEALNGNIILSKYNGEQWDERVIITNQDNDIFNIYFKTVVYENKVHIIFSIFNKEKNIATLFHQILDEKNYLYTSKIIDRIKYNYNVPFILYSSKNQELFIMYQKFVNSHEIGYKIFRKTNQQWSNFRLIDKSTHPFNDYSGVMINGILHALYIKKEENLDILNYVHDNCINLRNIQLFQSTNIENCFIIMILSEIWCFWTKDNKIYCSFSINNGKEFCTFPYEKSLNSSEFFKAIYISNNLKERNSILCNEMFLSNDDSLKYLVFSTLYPYNEDDIKSTDYQSYIEYYMTEISIKVLSYEKKLIQRENFIAELNYQLEDQKLKTLPYERNLNSINKQYTKFMDLKNQLNENINLLQQCLADKEEKIKLLENINVEKDKEKIALKNQISKEENKILFLINEVKKLNDNFRIMYANMYKQRNYILKK